MKFTHVLLSLSFTTLSNCMVPTATTKRAATPTNLIDIERIFEYKYDNNQNNYYEL
ncbi:hypothetical protein K502DRAFT_353961, partial [Neoconidiobolus thromboides FSU 785]